MVPKPALIRDKLAEARPNLSAFNGLYDRLQSRQRVKKISRVSMPGHHPPHSWPVLGIVTLLVGGHGLI
jgi:hypothetical protein